MKSLSFSAVALLASVMACSDATSPIERTGVGQVHVYSTASAYTTGSVVSFIVDNVGAVDVTYGACVDGIERQAHGSWVPATNFSLPSGCDAILLLASAGHAGRGSISLAIPATAPLGTYRVRMTRMRDDVGEKALLPVVYSDPFNVVVFTQ